MSLDSLGRMDTIVNGKGNEMIQTCKPFALGRVVATPAALESISESGEDGKTFLDCHARGDWGEVSADDWKINDEALIAGDRLLSAYTLKTGKRLWIITEADRSVSTLLLADEY